MILDEIDDNIEVKITEIASNYKTGYTLRRAIVSVLVRRVRVSEASNRSGIDIKTLRKWCNKVRNTYDNRDKELK